MKFPKDCPYEAFCPKMFPCEECQYYNIILEESLSIGEDAINLRNDQVNAIQEAQFIIQEAQK